jgi:ubiquinone/menaquinone biosynthesis C-methylase UbiE
MNDAEFRLLDEIEEGHWWFVGKRLILRRLLERINTGRMLDLGCGTGGVLRDWKGSGGSVGIDRSSLAPADLRAQGV